MTLKEARQKRKPRISMIKCHWQTMAHASSSTGDIGKIEDTNEITIGKE
jgi:hypothetical protein